jgi:hypothetical protein
MTSSPPPAPRRYQINRTGNRVDSMSAAAIPKFNQQRYIQLLAHSDSSMATASLTHFDFAIDFVSFVRFVTFCLLHLLLWGEMRVRLPNRRIVCVESEL